MEDLDKVLDMVRQTMPDVICDRLRVAHPDVDDDGIWFFRRPGVADEVQIQSSTENCPFLVEHDRSSERSTCTSPQQTAATILRLLT